VNDIERISASKEMSETAPEHFRESGFRAGRTYANSITGLETGIKHSKLQLGVTLQGRSVALQSSKKARDIRAIDGIRGKTVTGAVALVPQFAN
jgi:hypothetical protein